MTGRGQERHVGTPYRKMRNSRGKKLMLATARDLEERAQLEQRLEVEMSRLRSIVESSGVLIALTDRYLNVVMINNEFTAVTGVTGDKALGRPLKTIVECKLDTRVMDDWLSGRSAKPERYANEIVDTQGRRRVISVTATPVRTVTEGVSNIVFLGVDDTERREAEQTLFAADRMMTLGEMAAAVAHEISQPLSVINLACEAAEQELDEAIEDSAVDLEFVSSKLARIRRQVDRASRIVADLRAFMRGTGADEGAAPFDAMDAVRGAVDLTAAGLRRQRTVLTLTVADEMPWIIGNIGKLEQVLVNLINNARDAGGLTIDLIVEAAAQDGRRFVRIAVADSGPGIPPHVLPRLFTSFVTTKSRGNGTGLGLRICRRIIEEMGGSISAANRPEGGAHFEILLPAVAE